MRLPRRPPCATPYYGHAVKTVTHRELRNHSGEVLRAVAAGETYDVTNHGTVVARLVPPPPTELQVAVPASERPRFADLPRFIASSSETILDDLRGDR